MKIFFNSSMPRSGSTLLQNILGNDPRIYATPTSGLLDIMVAAKKIYTEIPAFKAQDENEMKSAFLMFCRYGIEGYFKGLTDRPYAIDKCRGWGINHAFLSSFYPGPKVICMVRDLRDVIASMEKNFRRYPERWDQSQDPDSPKGVTVADRVKIWMNERPVGSTLKHLSETIQRGYAKKMLFVRFEDLCQDPEGQMRRVYEYIDVPFRKVDYDNVSQVTHEDDKFHGRFGDHIISPKVRPLESRSVEYLGQRICDLLYENNKWYFDRFGYKK